MPVLVEHGEKDRMFPVKPGEELHARSGDCAEFMVIPEHGHNEPFRRPRMEHLGPILEWLVRD